MAGDWIKLHRKLLENPIMQHEGMLRLWIYLLLKANWKDSTWLIPGTTKQVVVPRGSLIVGRQTLHKALYPKHRNDDPAPLTVWRWLLSLSDLGCITVQNMYNHCSLVTICHYSTYQQTETDQCTTDEQPMNNRRTTDEQPMNTLEEGKEKKEGKEGRQVSGEVSPKPPLPKASENGQPKSRKKRDKLIIPYSPDFEAFWKAFPNVRKTNKPKAFEIWPSAVQSIILERMCDGEDAVAFLVRRATEYAASEQGKSKWCRGPCPWLNQAAWNDPAEAWLDKSRERPLFQTLEPADKVQARQQAEFGGKFSPMFAHLEGQQNGNT